MREPPAPCFHSQVSSQRGRPRDEPSYVSYGSLAGGLLPSFGGLGRALLEREQRRSAHLFHLLTQLGPLVAGLAQVEEALRWIAAADPQAGVVGELLGTAGDHVVSGTESLLAEPGVRTMDQSRVLMEIEFLLLDFAASPRRIELWQSLEDAERETEFGFDMLRRRHQARTGIPSDRLLFDAEEYRIHSRGVHPRPGQDGVLAPPDVVTGLFLDTGDLLHHAFRVWTAGTALFDRQGSDVRGMPGFPAMEAVDDALRLMDQANGRLAAVR
jgi:hypothetical protein